MTGLISCSREHAPGEVLTAEMRAKAYPFHNMPIVIAGKLYRTEGDKWEPEPQPQEEPCVESQRS